VPPLSPVLLSQVARGDKFDPAHLAELKWRVAQSAANFGVAEGVDPKDIAQTGWAVIFPAATDQAIKDALGELLAHRKAQANRLKARYHEYVGPTGFQPGDTKNTFLARLGAGPGPVDPDVVPYYLLIVSAPDTIPYSFQAQLDVAYAVGRIHFDALEDYARYAHSIVQAERDGLCLPRRATFFGVSNRNDSATSRTATELVSPLAEQVQADQPAWSISTVLGEAATKARLAQLMGGEETPALLFTACHGIGFNLRDPRQYQQQGALVCQDWPGPIEARGRSLSAEWYLAAEDVMDDAQPFGTIAFHFACFGAGTPQFDEFAHLREGVRERSQVAPASFVAGLPKRLLAHPRGGALAVISHIERVWTTSFTWERTGGQLMVFRSALKRLMEGHPVGSALEFFNQRYAELSTVLSSELEEAKFGKQLDPLALSKMWIAHNDARGYAVVGDPAVRLMTGAA
jgi:hypothetical protein